jgi:hypothetical protein
MMQMLVATGTSSFAEYRKAKRADVEAMFAGTLPLSGTGGVFVDYADARIRCSGSSTPTRQPTAVTIYGTFDPPDLLIDNSVAFAVDADMIEGLMAGVFSTASERPGEARPDLAGLQEQLFMVACEELRTGRATQPWRRAGADSFERPAGVLMAEGNRRVLQDDFSAGAFPATSFEKIPGNGVYDAMNLLVDDDRSLKIRGGSRWAAPAMSGGSTVTWMWSGTIGSTPRTIVGESVAGRPRRMIRRRTTINAAAASPGRGPGVSLAGLLFMPGGARSRRRWRWARRLARDHLRGGGEPAVGGGGGVDARGLLRRGECRGRSERRRFIRSRRAASSG